MPSRRLATVLGPLIALLLIGGVTAAVLGGGDDVADTDFAAEPTEDTEDFTDEPTPATSETASPQASPTQAQPTTEPGETEPGNTQPGDTQTPVASESAAPAPPASTTPPSASPRPAPTSDVGDIADEPAVDDGSLTGGWVGGTPNTGTAISAVGLLLLLVGGGLLWLRRSRA